MCAEKQIVKMAMAKPCLFNYLRMKGNGVYESAVRFSERSVFILYLKGKKMVKLKIKIPEQNIKISFKLKESLIKGLKEYAEFLSISHNKLISQDLVMESIIEKVLKDKDFNSFMLKKSCENNLNEKNSQ